MSMSVGAAHHAGTSAVRRADPNVASGPKTEYSHTQGADCTQLSKPDALISDSAILTKQFRQEA